MVYRIYVEKKPGLEAEAKSLLGDARNLLGIERLENVRSSTAMTQKTSPRSCLTLL